MLLFHCSKHQHGIEAVLSWIVHTPNALSQPEMYDKKFCVDGGANSLTYVHVSGSCSSS